MSGAGEVEEGAGTARYRETVAEVALQAGARRRGMKVVAYTKGGDMLLIIPGDSLEAALAEDSPRARVLWISKQLLGTPKPLYRLLETRHWEKTEYPDEELPEILAGVTVEGPPIDEPWVF